MKEHAWTSVNAMVDNGLYCVQLFVFVFVCIFVFVCVFVFVYNPWYMCGAKLRSDTPHQSMVDNGCSLGDNASTALYTVRTLYTVHNASTAFALFTVHCTLYTVFCTLYTVRCTLCAMLQMHLPSYRSDGLQHCITQNMQSLVSGWK